MAHATAAELIERFDVRLLGDLVADDGTQVDSGDLAANAKVIAALLSASGQVDAKAREGDRYTAADLAALTGNANGYLIHITCLFAIRNLVRRRLHYIKMTDALRELLDEAREAMEDLRTGKEIFDVDGEEANAGKPSVDGPTTLDICNLNLVVSQTQRTYPQIIRPFNR